MCQNNLSVIHTIGWLSWLDCTQQVIKVYQCSSEQCSPLFRVNDSNGSCRDPLPPPSFLKTPVITSFHWHGQKLLLLSTAVHHPHNKALLSNTTPTARSKNIPGNNKTQSPWRQQLRGLPKLWALISLCGLTPKHDALHWNWQFSLWLIYSPFIHPILLNTE
jgi:hypothetical protein